MPFKQSFPEPSLNVNQMSSTTPSSYRSILTLSHHINTSNCNWQGNFLVAIVRDTQRTLATSNLWPLTVILTLLIVTDRAVRPKSVPAKQFRQLWTSRYSKGGSIQSLMWGDRYRERRGNTWGWTIIRLCYHHWLFLASICHHIFC